MSELEAKPAPWKDRRTVVTLDGPTPHAWYFRDDWQTRVDASTLMGRRPGEKGDTVLGYQLTGQMVPHPVYFTAGEGLRWAA